MNRCVFTTLGLALALACGASIARGDVEDKVRHMRSPKDSKEFAAKAADSGMFEVRVSRLAQDKAQSEEVKRLARELEEDHTRANEELTALAREKNIDLPKEIDAECRETYEAFSRLDGKDFDNAYLLHQTKAHLAGIAMFRQQAKNGDDADIRAWASKTLPTLERHAAHIRPVAAANGLPIEVLAGTGTMRDRDAARPAGGTISGSSTDRDRNKSTLSGDRDKVSGSGAGPEPNDAKVGSGGNENRNDLNRTKDK
jgi:putative membrane protein